MNVPIPVYQLWLCNNVGMRLALLQDWSSLTYSRLHPVQSVGTLAVRVPKRYLGLIQVAGMVEVWMTPLPGMVPVHEGTYIIDKITRSYYDVAIGASHTTQLLKFRIVVDASGTAGANKSGPADDLIKAYAREQMATLTAATARNLNNVMPFSVEADHGQGVSVTKEAAHATLLQAAQDIVKAAQESLVNPMWVSFGVENVGHDTDFALMLRTWVGYRSKDHSLGGRCPLVLSRFNCLDEIVREIDHTQEVNVAVIGGSGSGAGRVTQTVENTLSTALAPYWRREAWVDGGNNSDTETLNEKGTRKLREAKALDRFRATVKPHPSAAYGVHFDLGDLVAAEAEGRLWDCRVEGIVVTGDTGGVKLDVKLEIL
jgi:hypothetical protein